MNLYSYDIIETLCCVVKLSFLNVIYIFRYNGCVNGHSLVPLSSNSIKVYIFLFLVHLQMQNESIMYILSQ